MGVFTIMHCNECLDNVEIYQVKNLRLTSMYDTFVWLTRELRHVSEKLTIKVNVNFLHFIPTQTCFEKKTCVNRKHNSTFITYDLISKLTIGFYYMLID